MTPWWQGRMCAFDVESTGVNVEADRIVTAAVVLVGGRIEPERLTLLSDVDGEEIPEAATAIHGVSTERARADGQPAADVVLAVRCALATAIEAGYPLVAMNARFDLTILDRELRRHGLDPLPPPLVVDPFVIDKQLDRYRRGSRKLDALCEHYRAGLDAAHDAAFDAIAAARLAYRIGSSGEVVRRVRNAQEGRELAVLKREWEDVRGDLGRLHDAQRRWALAERTRFAAYKRSVGEDEAADRIAAEVGWPVLDLMSHELQEVSS